MDNKILIALLVALGLLVYGCTAAGSANAPTNGTGAVGAPSAPAPTAPSGAYAPGPLPGDANDTLMSGNSSVDSDPTAGLISDSSLPDAPQ